MVLGGRKCRPQVGICPSDIADQFPRDVFRFQRDMYDRRFDTLEMRLTLLTDELFELARAGAEAGSDPTLISEADRLWRWASVERG